MNAFPYAVTPADLRRSAALVQARDPGLAQRLTDAAERAARENGQERDRLAAEWKAAAEKYGARSYEADRIWRDLRAATHRALGART